MSDPETVLYCANHPSVATMLRCNRCSKPICVRCAVRTPVGYRCKECVGRQQAVFYSGGPLDYGVGAITGLVLGGLAGFLMLAVRGWFFGLILGPAVGVGIAEAVRFVVRRRRSRYLWLAVSAGIVLGAVAGLLLRWGRLDIWSLLTLGIFLVLSVGAVSARLR